MKNREEVLFDYFLSSNTLTEWEDNFVDSCGEQYDRKKELSPRQMEILEDIKRKDVVRR